MTARKQKPTWSDLKRQLADLDRRALLGLIQDLYTASKNNQAFLHARFALGEDVLDPYKATIDRWVCPDVMRNQDISVAKCEYVRLNRPRTPSDVAGTHKITAGRAHSRFPDRATLPPGLLAVPANRMDPAVERDAGPRPVRPHPGNCSGAGESHRRNRTARRDRTASTGARPDRQHRCAKAI